MPRTIKIVAHCIGLTSLFSEKQDIQSAKA